MHAIYGFDPYHVYFHPMYCIFMFALLIIIIFSSKVAMLLFLSATSEFHQVCNVVMSYCYLNIFWSVTPFTLILIPTCSPSCLLEFQILLCHVADHLHIVLQLFIQQVNIYFSPCFPDFHKVWNHCYCFAFLHCLY